VADLSVLPFMVAAGLATGLGALPIFVLRRISPRVRSMLLAFASGIMLAVVFFDLLPDAAAALGPDTTGLVASVVFGAATILVLAKFANRLPVPKSFRARESGRPGLGFLIFLALAIHNAPEGLATALGYAGGLTMAGHVLALAIALQNIPEGLLVALPLLAETGSRRWAFGWALISGIVEPVSGVAALLFLTVTPSAIGASYGFAAGAMLAAVLSQILPQGFAKVRPALASLSLGAALIAVVHAAVGLLA